MKNELAPREHFAHMIEHYTGVIEHEWRIWRTDIYQQQTGKWVGANESHFPMHGGDLVAIAEVFTKDHASWRELGYDLIGGFVTIELAQAEVDRYQAKLEKLG